jgi:hypothetical protein
MKFVVLLIAALMTLLGLIGICWPEGLVEPAKYSFTANGIYVAAAVRILVGALLFFGATTTRTPKSVRVIGLVLVLAGVATAFLSGERGEHLKDWWLGRGPDALRIAACLPLAVGVFIALSALSNRKRPGS